jgi:hypothetical protein
MIVGERKPVTEIIDNLKGYRKVLVLACGTCVTVCMSGGEKEAQELASLLRLKGFQAQAQTVERQCEKEFNLQLQTGICACEAVVSLACGIGVQVLADCFPPGSGFSGTEHHLHGSSGRAGNMGRALFRLRRVFGASFRKCVPDHSLCQEPPERPLWGFQRRKVRSEAGARLCLATHL